MSENKNLKVLVLKNYLLSVGEDEVSGIVFDDFKKDKAYLAEESNSDSTSDSLDSVDPVNPVTTATSTDLEGNLMASIKLPCNTQDQNNSWLARHSIKRGSIHTSDAESDMRHSNLTFHNQPVVMNYFCLKKQRTSSDHMVLDIEGGSGFYLTTPSLSLLLVQSKIFGIGRRNGLSKKCLRRRLYQELKELKGLSL